MLKGLNKFLKEVDVEKAQGSFSRYNLGVSLTKELYDKSLETLIMQSVGDNKEGLEEQGIVLEGDFEEELEVRNTQVLQLVRKLVAMRFGYDEVSKNMNKDRIFKEDEDSMKKEELTYKHYPNELIDFDENKGIYAGDEENLESDEENRAVFLPMYHRSATMEFRILEGGVIKMTDLDEEDTGVSIVIMPVKDYDIIDVLLVDKKFAEYHMSEEEFAGLRDNDAISLAWHTIMQGEAGKAHLEMVWSDYQMEKGEIEPEEESEDNQLDYLDRVILMSQSNEGLGETQSGEEEGDYLFTKDYSKVEENNEMALLMEDAYTKYKAIFDDLREKRIEEKSLKMARVINTIVDKEAVN